MALQAPPAKEALGLWITEREARWNSLESSDYRALPVEGSILVPFEARAVNAQLLPPRWVYGGGYRRFHQPQFFLGELELREIRQGIEVLVAGRECARGISAPPAVYQNGAILVRRDALRRWLREKISSCGASRREAVPWLPRWKPTDSMRIRKALWSA
ncbi:MAG TPA: hypothetical protein VF104_03910 [Burkholderiales bacterium]